MERATKCGDGMCLSLCVRVVVFGDSGEGLHYPSVSCPSVPPSQVFLCWWVWGRTESPWFS